MARALIRRSAELVDNDAHARKRVERIALIP